MSLLKNTFEKLRSENRAALISYITGGDPNQADCLKILESLFNGGTDIIEIGIPFSDPIADGPIIQAASHRSLTNGTNIDLINELIKKFRKKYTIPIVLLSYYNTILHYGVTTFFKNISNVGVDGVIIPDLPVEESLELKKIANKYNVDTIFLVTPTTPNLRIKKLLNASSGFLYVVSRYGVTGISKSIDVLTSDLITRINKYNVNSLPLCVGFGISNKKHVEIISKLNTDGVIIGSALVDIISKNISNIDVILNKLENTVRNFKSATFK